VLALTLPAKDQRAWPATGPSRCGDRELHDSYRGEVINTTGLALPARRSHRRGATFAALSLVGALVLTSCGDSGDSADAGIGGTPAPTLAGTSDCAGTGASATTGPAAGKPIKVGAVVGATGVADFSSASKAAKAYFDCVNATGGINGRPVDYVVKDDNWDPAKATQVARQLVQDEQVVAMVGSTSFVECGSNAKYYEQNDIFVIAGVGVPRECFHSPNIAPTNQGPRLSGIGAAQYAKEKGATSLSCVSNVIPNFGAWVCAGVEAWGKRANVKVQSFLGKPDASDAASIALRAIKADTDAVVVVDAGPSLVPYLKAAEQQGSGGKDKPWYLPTSAYDLKFPAAVGSYWNDKLFAQIELSPLDSTGPDNTAWKGVMAKYGADAPRDSFSQAGFLSAKIFTDSLRAMTGEVTRSSVTAALKAVRHYKTDLTCGPWYFGDAAGHNPNHAGRIVKMTGSGATGFETVKECFEVEDPDLDAIRAAEKSG
jgi:branched-chain amino acid transport system substrate-binding protein